MSMEQKDQTKPGKNLHVTAEHTSEPLLILEDLPSFFLISKIILRS